MACHWAIGFVNGVMRICLGRYEHNNLVSCGIVKNANNGAPGSVFISNFGLLLNGKGLGLFE